MSMDRHVPSTIPPETTDAHLTRQARKAAILYARTMGLPPALVHEDGSPCDGAKCPDIRQRHRLA